MTGTGESDDARRLAWLIDDYFAYMKYQGQAVVERHCDGAMTLDGRRYDATIVERMAREWEKRIKEPGERR
jgi:hypothetical protein